MIKVLEMDQWSSTAKNLKDFSLEDFEKRSAFNSLEGGDAQAAKVIFGGTCRIKEVDARSSPYKGEVWFVNDENGKLKLFKANYDSSD